VPTVHVLRGALIALAAFGAFLIYSGFHLRYYVRTGPGPGFFPIWIGGLLVATSLAAVVESLFAGGDSEPFLPTRDAVTRVLLIIAALAATWFALEYLGYRLSILLFALAVPQILGRQSLLLTVPAALIVSFGVAYIFQKWLGVWLPPATLEPLASLGL
jgi:putative tricarboxylic transport membrane protein